MQFSRFYRLLSMQRYVTFLLHIHGPPQVPFVLQIISDLLGIRAQLRKSFGRNGFVCQRLNLLIVRRVTQ